MTRHPSLPDSMPVWDRFVRLFHWLLVSCVMLNYFVLDDGETLHQLLGYLATALVVARIAWGFIGSTYARFASFFPTPKRLQQHISQLARGQPDRHWGHNPLGALMILALIGLVLGLGVSGWMQTLDAYWGDERLQDTHQLLGNILIGLVALHAASALIMGRLERTHLIRAMFTGIKVRW